MRTFTTTELARMRAAQNSAMQDTCKIGVYSATDDAYNNPAEAYDYSGDPVACGVEHVAPDELQGTGQVPDIDVRLRLPVGTAVKPTDRVRITHRYGEDVIDQDYAIVGPAKCGPTGLVLELRKVTDE